MGIFKLMRSRLNLPRFALFGDIIYFFNGFYLVKIERRNKRKSATRYALQHQSFLAWTLAIFFNVQHPA
jgi:hypothetical protein